MGIDVYLNWNGKTEEEKEAQLTGFSTVHGHAGYLREAYHGGPYATKVLVPEAFDARSDHTCGTGAEESCEACRGVHIPAATLRDRLRRTLIAALCRDAMLYGRNNKIEAGENESMEDVLGRLAPKLMAQAKAANSPNDSFELDVPEHVMGSANLQLALALAFGWLPEHVKSFSDFVDLAEKLESEGKDPRVYVCA